MLLWKGDAYSLFVFHFHVNFITFKFWRSQSSTFNFHSIRPGVHYDHSHSQWPL